MMEWSNKRIIEFLKEFQKEPCLWDPQDKNYKSRYVQMLAWHRIKESLSFPVTKTDLKKKRESLMGYYRQHINKYKKSLQSGSDTSEKYRTNWFAFDIMHSFLAPIYTGGMDNTINIESNHHSPHPKSEQSEGWESTSTSPTHDIRPSSIQSNYNQSSGFHFVMKNATEIPVLQKQIDEAFDPLKSLPRKSRIHDYDEFDNFALMIAAKIRKINDFEERETVMNAIQNLVFQSIMKNRRKNNST